MVNFTRNVPQRCFFKNGFITSYDKNYKQLKVCGFFSKGLIFFTSHCIRFIVFLL